MNVVIGLDIGTSGARALGVDEAGNVRADAAVEYPLLTPRPGWTEQHPEPAVKKSLDQWAGCLSGTIPIEEYRSALEGAGFVEAEFEVHATESMAGVDGKIGSAYIRARKP